MDRNGRVRSEFNRYLEGNVQTFESRRRRETRRVSREVKYGLGFELLSDPEKKVMTKYGTFGAKMMYGKKVLGVIRSTFLISPTGTIERAWYAVRADGHAAKVLKLLEG